MEAFSALLALCEGNSPVIGEFPSQRPVMRSFDVFFDMHLNHKLGKHSRRCLFEIPSHPLWRHCNGVLEFLLYALNTWVVVTGDPIGHRDDNLRTVIPVTTLTILYRIDIWHFHRQSRGNYAICIALHGNSNVMPGPTSKRYRYDRIPLSKWRQPFDVATIPGRFKCPTWKRYRWWNSPATLRGSFNAR